MICDLITDQTYLEDVVCTSWEELVEIGGGLLVQQGSVEPRFIQSIKDTIAEFGSYMVLVDDIAFFHGRPEAGVKETSMSLALLRNPVYLSEKRIKASDRTAIMNLMIGLDSYTISSGIFPLIGTGGDAAKNILRRAIFIA